MADDLLPTLLAVLTLALAGGVLCGVLWLLRPILRGPLLPADGITAVPWTGKEVVLAFLFWVLFQATVTTLLDGVLQWVHGEALSTTRRQIWAFTLSAPFLILALVAGLYHLTGTRPAQLGLTTSRLGPDVIMGYLVWSVVTPPVLFLYFFITLWIKPEPHPLQSLAGEAPALAEWVLIIAQAVLIAPVLEELLFRGLVQRWLRRATMIGHLGVALATLFLVVQAAPNLFKDWGQLADLDFLLHPATLCVIGSFAFFGLGLLPGYLLLADSALRALGRTWPPLPGPMSPTATWHEAITTAPARPVPDSGGLFTASPPDHRAAQPVDLPDNVPLSTIPPINDMVAIYGSALLFAAFHSAIWPSPIPLFFLGLGLGWLAYRTQSLVGPMVAHALFNAVACIVLAFEAK